MSVTQLPYGPVVDGDVLVRPAADQLRDGSFIKVPYIMGTNNDEASIYTPLGLNTAHDVFVALQSPPTNMDFGLAAGLVSRYLNDGTDNVIEGVGNYQLNTTIGLQFKRFLAIMTDAVFVAGTQFSADQWQKNSNESGLYVYNANTTISQGGNWYGAGHGFELAYTYRSFTGIGWEGDEPPFAGGSPFLGRPKPYYELSDVMSTMWISFFNTLNPNYKNRKSGEGVSCFVNHGGASSNACTESVPEWPAFEGNDPDIMIFDAQPDKLNTRIGKEQRKDKNKWFASQLYPENK